MAGEIGHVVVDESGIVCRCGQRGCLEAVAAGPAIARAWPRGESGSAATALFTAAAEGDPAADKVAARIAGHLTTALIWLAAAYDAERVILAGGVSAAGAPFLEAIRAEVRHRGAASELAARRLQPDQVTLALTDDLPGPRGAAVLAATRILQTREAPAGTKASNDT
jgi:predicted NBD/HSP70 family sugar kinase